MLRAVFAMRGFNNISAILVNIHLYFHASSSNKKIVILYKRYNQNSITRIPRNLKYLKSVNVWVQVFELSEHLTNCSVTKFTGIPVSDVRVRKVRLYSFIQVYLFRGNSYVEYNAVPYNSDNFIDTITKQ